MEKLMKMPSYIPIIGLIISFALLFAFSFIPEMAILIAGLVLFHLSGWVLPAKYLLIR